MIRILIFPAFLLFSVGCEVNEEAMKNVESYEGPLYEVEDVEILYSEPVEDDKATVKFKLIADLQLIFENEDIEYPEGVYIENYNQDQEVVFTLKANQGYYDAEEDQYRGVGDVEVRNLETKESLFTEELFWKPGPGDDAIYTDKFVHIITETASLRGVGLRATQDFSEYTILDPGEGSILVNENEQTN